MKRILLLTLLISLAGIKYADAQTSAGKALYFDYDLWNQGGIYPPMYVDCGSSNAFNTGNELTLEIWMRVFDAGWNQKIMGKMDDQLNNGYVMGIELLKNYSEVFNPSHYELKAGSMPLDSSWIHLAMTYKAGDALKLYINGENVGEQSVSNNPLAANSNPFRIGLAPWDIHALQFFGHLDEARVWNIARTEIQIQENMFRRTSGSEANLIAYYDFDDENGATVSDLSGSGNDATVICDEEEYWWWDDSYAPVGDDVLSQYFDLAAAWPGKGEVTGPYAATQNGLSLLTDIVFKQPQYVVFGHNNASGVTTENLDPSVPASFESTARDWYMNKAGNVHADMLFDLSNAAGGDTELPSDKDVSYYTLFTRNSESEDFVPLVSANTKTGDIITFKNVNLQNKYYTIGVGDESIAPPSNIIKVQRAEMKIYPNPTTGYLFIESNTNNNLIEVFNTNGQIVKTLNTKEENSKIDVSDLKSGTYIISLNRETYETIFIID